MNSLFLKWAIIKSKELLVKYIPYIKINMILGFYNGNSAFLYCLYSISSGLLTYCWQNQFFRHKVGCMAHWYFTDG